MADVLEPLEARHGIEASATPEPEIPSVERRTSVRQTLTIEVSNDLHRRILLICATRRVPVNQAVREVLERAFPGV